jgi:hypothetical protein
VPNLLYKIIRENFMEKMESSEAYLCEGDRSGSNSGSTLQIISKGHPADERGVYLCDCTAYAELAVFQASI